MVGFEGWGGFLSGRRGGGVGGDGSGRDEVCVGGGEGVRDGGGAVTRRDPTGRLTMMMMNKNEMRKS